MSNAHSIMHFTHINNLPGILPAGCLQADGLVDRSSALKAYPGNFRAYESACRHGEVRLGKMFTYETGQLDKPRFVINFPTKGHWRSKSKLTDIKAGLASLRDVIRDRRIGSIAIPPLGCGNGSLDWSDVRPLIVEALGDLPGVTVMMYPPQETPSAKSMPVRTRRPRMTAGRAALLAMLGSYVRLSRREEPATEEGASLLEIQKLMYFLQERGQSLRLNYVKARYGPYADNLNHALEPRTGSARSRNSWRGSRPRTASNCWRPFTGPQPGKLPGSLRTQRS